MNKYTCKLFLVLLLIPAKHITSRKSRDTLHEGITEVDYVLCKYKFQLMARHEAYPKQNQNKEPELGKDVIIFILSTYSLLYYPIWFILQGKWHYKTCSISVLSRGGITGD